MVGTLIKLLQRRFYDLISSRIGCIVVIFTGLSLLISILHFGEIVLLWSTERYHALGPSFASSDNIGGRSYISKLCPPFPIDVVYTWVNGSDPQHLGDRRRYLMIERKKHMNFSVRRNGSATVSPTQTCGWNSCHQWLDRRLIFCPHSPPSKFESNDSVIVHKTNSSFTLLTLTANKSLNLNQSCVASTVFVTPDKSPMTKLLLPGASWVSGRPFEDKKTETGRSFVNQLDLILRHIQSPTGRKVDVFYFHDGCIIFCHPSCNSSLLEMTLGAFSSLSLTQKPLYLVWNDTGPTSVDVNNGNNLNDDTIAQNRYEDNEELRYSLRSVDTHAPWVRRIYIVTNGQVPSWLRLDHPRLRIVTHAEIFRNSSDLPTFNSPAIEMHLHRIPGLSKYFIYLNDDVFFGAPVLPDDFYTHARGQRVFLTWAVPNCRVGCPSNWLNDGYCDKACNFPECDFDAGDCGPDGKSPVNRGPYAIAANAWAAAAANAQRNPAGPVIPGQSQIFQHPPSFRPFCHGACADAWLGDGTCDGPCNRIECAFDSGDCGDVNFGQLCAVRVLDKNINSTIDVPAGVTEFLVDFTRIWSNVTWKAGRYWVNTPNALRSITLAKKYRLVVVLLYKKMNDTIIELSLNALNNLAINVTLRAKTGVNETCPVTSKFERPQDVLPSHQPTMLPYEHELKGPHINETSFRSHPPANISIEELELRINDKIAQSPNSTLSSVMREAAQELEHDWSQGFLTDTGYRYFMWHLLTGVPVRVTADRRRSIRTGIAKYLQDVGWRKRRLLSYEDSLRYSNKLFNKKYGYESRKVPGHMPHLLNIDILNKIEQRFATEWRNTSRNRFRSSQDLQYSFTYFYFLMSEKKNITLTQWLSSFDTDHSNQLNPLELRSMALTIWGLPYKHDRLTAVLNNCTERNISLDNHELHISLLENCSSFEDAVKSHLNNISRYKYEVVGEEEIWFKMLTANLSRTAHHLDEIQTMRRKFLCLNDDMDHTGNPEEARRVRKAMNNLFRTLFPKPSQFELSVNHNFLYIDDWKRFESWKRTQRTLKLLMIILLISSVMLIVYRRRCLNSFLFPIRILRRKLCNRRRPFVV